MASTFIEWNAEGMRTCCIVDRPLARASTIRTDITTVAPHDSAPFAPHALVVDPLVQHAQREALNNIDLGAFNFASCALIATLLTVQAREPVALKPARQSDHLRKQ
ncbi:hypothetical protein WL34_06210 [Burkholderia cepacia]|nr:hypothetical protein WL34_06210 [Burkholderia cepacia]